MRQACNEFLDSWKTFDNIFVYFSRNEQPIILSPNDKNKNAEIDIKEYKRIALHNADIVSGYRKVMQQKTDELIKIYKLIIILHFQQNLKNRILSYQFKYYQ